MSLAMGGALSATTLTAVFTHCASKKEDLVAEGLLFLNRGQYQTITAIADRIIPRTDTPGAIDAAVPEFIDMMLFDCYREADKKRFLSGLEGFSNSLEKDISNYSDEQLEAALTEYEKAVRQDSDRKEEAFFIRTVKELTLLGFFTSEPGATQALRYVAVPGKYEACIPIDENRAWLNP